MFHQRLAQDGRFLTPFAPELDIVVFAPRAANVEEASVLTRKIFQAAARRDLHLAVAEIPVAFLVADGSATSKTVSVWLV